MATHDIKDLKDSLMTNTAIRGIAELFNVGKKDIEIKSDLKDREIKTILKLQNISQEFKVKKCEKLIDKYMRLVLSKNRKSRKEILELVKGDAEQQAKKSIGDFMFNKNKNPMM